MADEQKILNGCCKKYEELLKKQVINHQPVLAHTEKYHDAYTTIDKIVDSFWERVPYICIAIFVVFLYFWLLTKLFKFFVRKTLENRSYTRQNLVLVLNRVGSTAILFFWFLNSSRHYDSGVHTRPAYECARWSVRSPLFAFKDIFQNLLLRYFDFIVEPFVLAIQCSRIHLKEL